MRVYLTSCGNIDRDQDPNQPLYGVSNKVVEVADFEEASQVCREYIDANGLGAGNWTGGLVLGADGSPVAKVSYNGRVWPPGGYEPGVEPLHEPSAARATPGR